MALTREMLEADERARKERAEKEAYGDIEWDYGRAQVKGNHDLDIDRSSETIAARLGMALESLKAADHALDLLEGAVPDPTTPATAGGLLSITQSLQQEASKLAQRVEQVQRTIGSL